eukprot:5780092-Pleurochrysis_carterae.AAC.1
MATRCSKAHIFIDDVETDRVRDVTTAPRYTPLTLASLSGRPRCPFDSDARRPHAHLDWRAQLRAGAVAEGAAVHEETTEREHLLVGEK